MADGEQRIRRRPDDDASGNDFRSELSRSLLAFGGDGITSVDKIGKHVRVVPVAYKVLAEAFHGSGRTRREKAHTDAHRNGGKCHHAAELSGTEDSEQGRLVATHVIRKTELDRKSTRL